MAVVEKETSTKPLMVIETIETPPPACNNDRGGAGL